MAPAPLLTVTIESGSEGPEVHLHAGGQGFWIARMVAVLGVPVRLCASFGGETGAVVRTLVEEAGVGVRATGAATGNGVYVHDRRGGERLVLADVPSGALSRHEVDELYGAALVEGLEADVCVLGGPTAAEVVPADFYRRLASDLAANGRRGVADLCGAELDAALEGGLFLARVSHEELLADGRLDRDDDDAVAAAAGELARQGARHVVISRAERPVIALFDGEMWQGRAPTLESVDRRGAGDALTAGLAAGLAQGRSLPDALRLGMAAGTLNVTRRGLATGRRAEVERLTDHVEVIPDSSTQRRRLPCPE